MRKNTLLHILTALLFAVSIYSMLTAASSVEEAVERPLQMVPTPSINAPIDPSPAWRQGVCCLPAWYHPCFGPIVTNIKYFDCDPYWVDNRNAIFREIYCEIEPLCKLDLCHRGRIPRELRKLCIVRRTYNDVEQRYDPCTNCCYGNLGAIACATLVPAGFGIGTESAVGQSLITLGGSWCLVGSAVTAAWCCLAKIHYDPPRNNCLKYFRSTRD